MKTLRELFELAKRTGKTLKEIFANVPGSYSTYRTEISKMLKSSPPAILGAHRWSYVEEIIGNFPESVIVECAKTAADGSYEYKYYQIPVSLNEEGQVTWGEGKEVEFDVVITTKNEAAQLLAESHNPLPNRVELLENNIGQVTIDEKTKKARVDIAQRAEVKNKNNRVYPAAVLKAAVAEAKLRLPLPMETMHRNEQNIGDTCALIKSIEFNEETGIVSLPEIEILDAGSGKVIQEYIDKGGKIEVSQRAFGSSITVTDESTGENYELITALHITGWDTVGNGSASVEGTDLTLESLLAQGQTLTPTATPAPTSTLAPTNSPINIAEIVQQTIASLVTPLQEGLTTAQQNMTHETRQLQLERYRTLAQDTLETILADTPRFSIKQKELIKARINIDQHFDKVSMEDVGSIDRVLRPIVLKEMEEADKLITNQVVERWNLPAAKGTQGQGRIINNYGGLTYSEMLNVAPIDANLYNTTVQRTINEITRENPHAYVMSETHPSLDIFAQTMDKFFSEHADDLKEEQKRLNETSQADVKVPVNLTSMYMVAVAWRLTASFEFAQLHPMMNLLENIPVQVWVGQQDSTIPPIERWEKYHAAENTDIVESEIQYQNVELGASYQPLHLSVTPHARAVTRGTVMDPLMQSLANGSREIRDLTNRMIWDLTIVEALKHNATKVETAATLVHVGSNKATATRWTVPTSTGILIDYEWVVSKDANGNVDKTVFRRLFPANGAATVSTSGNLTPMVLTDSGTTQPTNGYLYGTDWNFDTDASEIILTATGRAKLGATEDLELTYSYNDKNVRIFDAIAPAGTTFLDNLMNLRIALAEARNTIVQEHYTPECIAWNYSVKEKVTLGAQFTRDGTNDAQALNMMNEILYFDGTKTVWDTAIRENYIINAQMMSTLYGLHTPFTLSDEQRTDNKGNRKYFGEQWSGGKVPKPHKSSLIYVKNVDKLGKVAT